MIQTMIHLPHTETQSTYLKIQRPIREDDQHLVHVAGNQMGKKEGDDGVERKIKAFRKTNINKEPLKFLKFFDGIHSSCA